jgi:hypothetical protein
MPSTPAMGVTTAERKVVSKQDGMKRAIAIAVEKLP